VRAYNAARAKRLAEQKRLAEEGGVAAGGIFLAEDDGFMLDDQLNMSGRSALHQSFALGRSATRSNSPISPTSAQQKRALSPHAIAANQSKTFDKTSTHNNDDRQQAASTNKNVGFSVVTADRNSNSNNHRMNNSTSGGGDSPLRRLHNNGNVTTNSPKQQSIAVGGGGGADVDFSLGLSSGANTNSNNFFLMGGLGGSNNGRSTSPAQQHNTPRSASPSYGLGGGIPVRSESPSYQRGGVTPTHNTLMLFAAPPRSVSRSASPIGGGGGVGSSINRNPLSPNGGQPPNSTPRSTNLFATNTSMSRGATAAGGGGGTSPQNMLGGGAGLLSPGNMSLHQQQVRKEKSNYLRREEFRLFLMYVGDYMELYFYFEQIDTSGDKKVTLKEFTAAIPLLEGWGLVIGGSPSELFALLDVSGNNTLTFKEFSDWACKEHLVIVQ